MIERIEKIAGAQFLGMRSEAEYELKGVPADGMIARMTAEPTSNQTNDDRPAGFWVRLAAGAIDVIIVSGAVIAIAHAMAHIGRYLPIELSVLIAGLVYTTASQVWTGRTVGKAICSLRVSSRNGTVASTGSILLRETIGKLLSFLPFCLGFLWIGFSKKKRGWHDRLAGTIVLQSAGTKARARMAGWAVLLPVLIAAGIFGRELVGYYVVVRRVQPPPGAKERWMERPASAMGEVSKLDPGDDGNYVRWLEQNGASPIDYAMRVAAQHQLTLFGEVHEKREALQFLNAVIPDLYRRAGVTCVAMEVCLAKDNAQIQRLITGKEFDHELALTLARHQPFGIWGFKGYWDVFETVWRVNQGLKPDQPKMRVIGLDSPMDMPSVAMLGLEKNAASDCPLWEKLRVVRLLPALPRVLMRDAMFVDRIENQIIRRGEKGIVWIGGEHAAIDSRQAVGPHQAVARMGFMLHAKYGNKIGQVRFHGPDIPAKYIDPNYRGPGPAMANFLERIMAQRNNQAVGFDVIGSPFETIRDGGSMEYHFQPRLGLGDIASGYVFLCPWRQYHECDWLAHYVSPEMFVANKPFYQAFARKAGTEVRSADECNAFWSKMK